MVSKIIEKRVVRVEPGMVIEHGGSGRTEKLIASDWDGCQFRWPSPWVGKHDLAINIEITGRTFQWRNVSWYVKINMIFVNEDEPNTSVSGWLLVNPWDLSRVEEVA